MKIKVKDAVNALGRATAESDAKAAQSIKEGRGGDFDGYGKLFLKRSYLSELLGACELEIDVPPHMESTIM